MRLIRFAMLLGVVAFVGLVARRAIVMQTTGDHVNISIDRHKLQETGRETLARGRQAMATTGEYLERFGRQLETLEPAAE